MKEKSIYLRAFEPEDYILINKWRNDKDLQNLTGGSFRYVSSEMERSWVLDKIMHNTENVYLAICLNNDSKLMIGYLSINGINHLHRTADCGSILIGDRKYRNGIFLIDAFLQMYVLVFDSLNINRFTGLCLSNHKSSILMMEMLGMKGEGRIRESIFTNGVYCDQLLFSILRTEYYEMLKLGLLNYREIMKRVKEIKRSSAFYNLD